MGPKERKDYIHSFITRQKSRGKKRRAKPRETGGPSAGPNKNPKKEGKNKQPIKQKQSSDPLVEREGRGWDESALIGQNGTGRQQDKKEQAGSKTKRKPTTTRCLQLEPTRLSIACAFAFPRPCLGGGWACMHAPPWCVLPASSKGRPSPCACSPGLRRRPEWIDRPINRSIDRSI
jgi:hypothetical protein